MLSFLYVINIKIIHIVCIPTESFFFFPVFKIWSLLYTYSTSHCGSATFQMVFVNVAPLNVVGSLPPASAW